MYVSNPLSMKSFHEALAGNVHECLLKPSIGKASLFRSALLKSKLTSLA
jgi:hypothetical protein